MHKSFKTFLLESYIVIESYKDARQSFINQNIDPSLVDDTLKSFKELNDKHRIPAEDKDINRWAKVPFSQFNYYVNSIKNVPSNKQAKRQVKDNSIILKTWGDWVALIPLSKEASCFYGKGTEWCTAATKSKNYFDSYFLDQNVTLIYFINKSTGEKYAAAIFEGEDFEYFNPADRHISERELLKSIGLNITQYVEIIKNAFKQTKIKDIRTEGKIANLKDEIDDVLATIHNIGTKTTLFRVTNDILNRLLDDPLLYKAIDKDKIQQLESIRKQAQSDILNAVANSIIKDIDGVKYDYKMKVKSNLSSHINDVLNDIFFLNEDHPDWKTLIPTDKVKYIEDSIRDLKQIKNKVLGRE